MSHKDAKPKTDEQLRMEAFYTAVLADQGRTVGWGFDKHSQYLASYAKDAWAAWQAAQASLLAATKQQTGAPDGIQVLRWVSDPKAFHFSLAGQIYCDVEPDDTSSHAEVLRAIAETWLAASAPP